MSADGRVVLVAGVHGVIGRAAAEHFAAQSGTRVYGLSRRGEQLADVLHLPMDLLAPAEVQARLGDVRDVTHVIFAAYVEKRTAAERRVVNLALLENLLDVLEPASPKLRHITFYQGGKAYGADLGAFKTPAREDDRRLMPPNFYYDQEDALRRRQAGKPWSFTALRPEAVCGYGTGNPMNLAMVIAVYAVISKELGLPLRFPGSMAAYQALYQLTSSEILATAADWAGSEPRAANEIFNITNGDYFRWEHMWPRIARMFDMEAAYPVPMPLAEYMADKAPVWDAMVRKYGLQPIAYPEVAAWPFGDLIFNSGFDNISSTIKARKAGYHDCIDTEEMFSRLFSRLRRKKIIPA